MYKFSAGLISFLQNSPLNSVSFPKYQHKKHITCRWYINNTINKSGNTYNVERVPQQIEPLSNTFTSMPKKKLPRPSSHWKISKNKQHTNMLTLTIGGRHSSLNKLILDTAHLKRALGNNARVLGRPRPRHSSHTPTPNLVQTMPEKILELFELSKDSMLEWFSKTSLPLFPLCSLC